jgi:hypothetical protein
MSAMHVFRAVAFTQCAYVSSPSDTRHACVVL